MEQGVLVPKILLLSVFDPMCDPTNCISHIRILLCWWLREALRLHSQGWPSINMGTDRLAVFNCNKKLSISVGAG